MEKAKKSKKRPAWRRALRVCLVSLGAFLLLFFLTASILLTPKRLTPIAKNLIDGFLDAKVQFDTLQVSLFAEFPYVNLNIKNGSIVSNAFDQLPLLLRSTLPAGCDSLLRFEELSVSLHLPRLLRSQIDIRRVQLRNTTVNAYLSPYGKANWEILYADSTQAENENLKLNLQRIIFRDSLHIRYHSAPDSINATVALDRLFLRGNITTNFPDLFIERFSLGKTAITAHLENQGLLIYSGIDSLSISGKSGQPYQVFLHSLHNIKKDTLNYVRALPLSLSGEIAYQPAQPDSLFFNQLTLAAANIPLQLHGSLVLAGPKPRSHLECRIDSLPLARLIDIIPKSLVPELKDISTDIFAKIYASIDYPAYTLDVSTSGSLSYPPQNAYIQTLYLDASYIHQPDMPEFSGLEIKQCNIEATGLSLMATGSVQDPTGNPIINMGFTGHIDLDTLSKLLPPIRGLTARGSLDFDSEAVFNLKQILKGDLKDASLRGRSTAKGLFFHLPQDSILIMTKSGQLSFGTNQNTRDSLIEKGRQILRLSYRVDSASVRIKDMFHIALKDAHLSGRSAATVLGDDTTQIHPFTGKLSAGYLELKMPNADWLLLRQGKTEFSLLPSPRDAAIPVVSFSLSAQNFEFKDSTGSYALSQPQCSLQATHLRSASEAEQRRNARLDSLQTLYPDIPRDSLGIHIRKLRSGRPADELASGDIALEMDNNIKALLRQWKVEGEIQASGGAISTPYFPLSVTLGETNMELSTEELHLMQTVIRAGRSQIECTGKISNLRQALLGRGTLGVYGFIRSDTLDINELIHAANAGAQYAEAGVTVDNIEETSSLIIIPANVALNLKLFAGYSRYADWDLSDLSVGLISKNRVLQMDNFEANSPAGTFTLSALYATRSRNNITAGFDLELKDVQVNKLISLIPSIDTLAPMLRSFEGNVDCQISATAAMDTAMNILMPSLLAACRIQGRNMVLLDGETFTEISKQLHFKKRSRNLIERVSVDFLVRDNKIEVFPFIMEMDRYRVAVSGIHKLDMSFNYHISVLQSPLPFRVGVDISGTLDKLHYKIGKCKYRNTNIPSYVELINSTRLNLLQAIKNFDTSAAVEGMKHSELGIQNEGVNP